MPQKYTFILKIPKKQERFFEKVAQKAKLEFDVKIASGNIKRISKILHYGDNLQTESGLNEYAGYVIDEIDPRYNYVSLTNGIEIRKGEVIGDTNEKTL